LKEKLIIRNFGPIKEVDLDVGRFTILIGEQATGKSTVAKVLAVCRYFSYIVWDGETTGDNESSFSEGLDAWGLKEYVRENSYINYTCDDFSVVAQYSPHEQRDWFPDQNGGGDFFEYTVPVFTPDITPRSAEFKNLLLELEKVKQIIPTDETGIIARSIPTSFYLNDVKKVMDNPFYLPTQRGLQSIFSLGQSSIANLSDSLFSQLSKMDGIARHFTKETYIEPMDIYYKNVRGHGYIRKANETEYYSLFNAASGYQSIIPVVLTIKYYTEIKKKSKTFLIEEPEQNLFPNAQDSVMQYLVDKTVNYGNSILLTTQSPYIQTSLNNMMYAYQVGQKSVERTNALIDKKYWLNPEEVSAYRLLSDGTAKDILDKELMQIDAGEIDEVSRKINETWDKLANIQYNKADEN
jgi:predicted ATPase